MSSFRRESKSQPPVKSGEMSVFGFKKLPPREPEKQSLPKSASSLPVNAWWLVTTQPTGGCCENHGSFENFMGSHKSPPLSSSSMGPNSPKHHLLPVSHPLPEWVSRLEKSQFFKKQTFIASILNCKVFLFKKASGWRIIFQSQPESQKVTKKRNRSKKQTEKHEILEFPKNFSQKKSKHCRNDSIFALNDLAKQDPSCSEEFLNILWSINEEACDQSLKADGTTSVETTQLDKQPETAAEWNLRENKTKSSSNEIHL